MKCDRGPEVSGAFVGVAEGDAEEEEEGKLLKVGRFWAVVDGGKDGSDDEDDDPAAGGGGRAEFVGVACADDEGTGLDEDGLEEAAKKHFFDDGGDDHGGDGKEDFDVNGSALALHHLDNFMRR